MFKFKQFTIFHDRCAMKVGTDGILLGAWADVSNCQRILDIGTGTGLIALMLAQRRNASPRESPQVEIDAVEIDRDAYLQAQENIARSPWQQQLKIYNSAIQDYVQNYSMTCSKGYDLIVANPPFFNNTYRSANLPRALARHRETLTPLDLIQAANKLLKAEGRLAVIYPVEEAENLINLAKQTPFNFFCSRKLWIQPLPNSPIKRVLLELSRNNFAVQESTLIVEESKHVYTPDYLNLTKDFYL